MRANPKPSRQHDRHPLQIDLSSYLAIDPDRRPLKYVGVDVSVEGLGVVGFEDLAPGTIVYLGLESASYKLEVVWSKQDSVRKGIFHAGLKVIDPTVNLVNAFTRAGLLKVVQAYQFRQINRKNG